MIFHVKVPNTEREWLEVADSIHNRWNFPNCIGAVDGKHVVMNAPPKSGSIYYNYKGTHSIVLMGICDANYRFLYFEVGANGRISDGGVFNKTSFYQALYSAENPLNIPISNVLPNSDVHLPFFLVGDDAFALDTHLMKPYPLNNLTFVQRVFNYRMSRFRRAIENTFGILAKRFRVFSQPLQLNPDKSRSVVKAACALHNFLIDRNATSKYIQPNTADHYDEDGNLVLGSWRENTTEGTFYDIEHREQGGETTNVQEIRDELAQYFILEGEIDFQYDKI